MPYGHQVALSVGALAMLVYSGYLGGSMVYKHGVGVQRQGSGVDEKRKNLAEVAGKSE
jgi:uncharacterized membrane protein